jgi:hypothetical protein
MLRAATPERLSVFSERGLCRPDHRLGPGSAPARATRLRGAPVALAYMVELRRQLPLHRNCLGESPSSHSLGDKDDAAPDVVQFRASVFRVAASALHRVDGRERIGTPAGFLLCGGLLPGERDLHTSVVALKYPLVGLGICVCCLLVYLKPDAPGAEPSLSTSTPRVASVGATTTASGPRPAGLEEGSSSDTLPHRRS